MVRGCVHKLGKSKEALGEKHGVTGHVLVVFNEEKDRIDEVGGNWEVAALEAFGKNCRLQATLYLAG